MTIPMPIALRDELRKIAQEDGRRMTPFLRWELEKLAKKLRAQVESAAVAPKSEEPPPRARAVRDSLLTDFASQIVPPNTPMPRLRVKRDTA